MEHIFVICMLWLDGYLFNFIYWSELNKNDLSCLPLLCILCLTNYVSAQQHLSLMSYREPNPLLKKKILLKL